MRTGTALLLAGFLSFPATLTAQGVSGTYVMQGNQGPITVTLQTDAGGKVTGTMSGGGVTYTVEGMMQEGAAVGAIYDQSGGMFFQATVSGGQLMLTLYDAGQDGQPVYDSARQLVFASQGGVAAPGPVGKPPVQGPAGRAGPLGGGGGATGTLTGAWSCQSPEGPAQIIFRSSSQLEYNGAPLSYQVTGNVIRVSDGSGTAEYGYQLAGDNLTIQRPDGSTTQCRRGGGAGVAAPGMGQGGGALPAGQPGQFDHLLQGMLCSYSSSPDGGYSHSTRVSFDGRGGMQIGSEASWNVESGSGYSGGGGNRARYRVEGATVGSRVMLQFADGSTGVATVHFVTGGRITELMYEATLFGASLC